MQSDSPVIIEVTDEAVNERELEKKDGSTWMKRTQRAYAHLSGTYPKEMELQLEAGCRPYRLGRYAMNPDSFYVNRFGQLALVRHLVLQSLNDVD